MGPNRRFRPSLDGVLRQTTSRRLNGRPKTCVNSNNGRNSTPLRRHNNWRFCGCSAISAPSIHQPTQLAYKLFNVLMTYPRRKLYRTDCVVYSYRLAMVVRLRSPNCQSLLTCDNNNWNRMINDREYTTNVRTYKHGVHWLYITS